MRLRQIARVGNPSTPLSATAVVGQSGSRLLATHIERGRRGDPSAPRGQCLHCWSLGPYLAPQTSLPLICHVCGLLPPAAVSCRAVRVLALLALPCERGRSDAHTTHCGTAQPLVRPGLGGLWATTPVLAVERGLALPCCSALRLLSWFHGGINSSTAGVECLCWGQLAPGGARCRVAYCRATPVRSCRLGAAGLVLSVACFAAFPEACLVVFRTSYPALAASL